MFHYHIRRILLWKQDQTVRRLYRTLLIWARMVKLVSAIWIYLGQLLTGMLSCRTLSIKNKIKVLILVHNVFPWDSDRCAMKLWIQSSAPIPEFWVGSAAKSIVLSRILIFTKINCTNRIIISRSQISNRSLPYTTKFCYKIRILSEFCWENHNSAKLFGYWQRLVI